MRCHSDHVTTLDFSIVRDQRILCADDTTLMAESEEELKSLVMKVKEV